MWAIVTIGPVPELDKWRPCANVHVETSFFVRKLLVKQKNVGAH
jgi:hypothetical protein